MCCIFVITLSKNLVDIFFLQKYPNIAHRLSTVGELGERGPQTVATNGKVKKVKLLLELRIATSHKESLLLKAHFLIAPLFRKHTMCYLS